VDLSTDNSWVCESFWQEQKQNGRMISVQERAYGQIRNIFQHTLHLPGNKITKVFVEVDDWLREQTQPNEISHLPVAKPYHHWDLQKIRFLDTLEMRNIVLWPSIPSSDVLFEERFDVIKKPE
jgi:hypothetical protein